MRVGVGEFIEHVLVGFPCGLQFGYRYFARDIVFEDSYFLEFPGLQPGVCFGRDDSFPIGFSQSLDQVLAESRRDRHFRIVAQCFFEVVDGLFLYRFVV